MGRTTRSVVHELRKSAEFDLPKVVKRFIACTASRSKCQVLFKFLSSWGFVVFDFFVGLGRSGALRARGRMIRAKPRARPTTAAWRSRLLSFPSAVALPLATDDPPVAPTSASRRWEPLRIASPGLLVEPAVRSLHRTARIREPIPISPSGLTHTTTLPFAGA